MFIIKNHALPNCFIPTSLHRTLALGASSGGLTPSAGDQLVQDSRRTDLASLFSWLLDAKAEMISFGFIPFLAIASDIRLSMRSFIYVLLLSSISEGRRVPVT